MSHDTGENAPIPVWGNAVDASRDTRGWFLGQFMPAERGPLRSADLEVKWYTHAKGEERAEWSPASAVRTLNILIRGHFVLRFPDRDVELRREGQPINPLPWLADRTGRVASR